MSVFQGLLEYRHCLFLLFDVKDSFNFMEVFHLFGNQESGYPNSHVVKSLTLVLVVAGAVIISGILTSPSGMVCQTIGTCMMPTAVLLWLMTSSYRECGWTGNMMKVIISISFILLSYNLLYMTDIIPLSWEVMQIFLQVLLDIMLVLMLVYGFMSYLRDVKTVMKTGTVWSIVCIIADVVYVIVILAVSSAWMSGLYLVSAFILGGAVVGMSVRIVTDSVFIIWRKQERIIVESMKVTSVTTAVDESRIDNVYKDLYERIMTYFEAEKPYLDGRLTITDIVRNLYSNKLYISKAISLYTGRNFCQFVNYYRVMHSIECFRNNPDLKIHELATMSGFNTIVSYNMAFRLFMGENPSDWCRMEKSRLIKRKK